MRILGAIAVALVAVGCGSDPSNENDRSTSVQTSTQSSSEAPPAANPCATDPVPCSNKEVTATNCDGSSGGPKAFDATARKMVRIGTVTGKLVGRKANAAQCLRVLWTLFEPSSDSSGGFKVTTQVDDAATAVNPDVVADQASEPGNDVASAWTEGLYAPEGTKVTFCVVVGTEQECIETPSV